jgi:hypothetical protein
LKEIKIVAKKIDNPLSSLSTTATNITGGGGAGRKIDTWTYRPDVGRELGLKPSEPIEFSVFMHRKPGCDILFSVTTGSIPASRWNQESSSDLSQLRRAADKAARTEFDLRHDLAWTQWLEVQVEQISEFDLRGTIGAAQGKMAYSPIPRAEDAQGRAYTVNRNNVLIDFPTNVSVAINTDDLTGSRGLPNGEKPTLQNMNKTDRRPTNTQFVYLPDTPENRAGLNLILQALAEVNTRMQLFLEPSKIQQTLERAMAGGQALIAGPVATVPRQSPRS